MLSITFVTNIPKKHCITAFGRFGGDILNQTKFIDRKEEEEMKKTLLIMAAAACFMAACTPTEVLVQTAIAQTRTVAPTATATEIPAKIQMQTFVPQTLTPAVGAALTDQNNTLQTAFATTLTAVAPTNTPTVEITLTDTGTKTAKTAPAAAAAAASDLTIKDIKDGGSNKVTVSWDYKQTYKNGFYVIWSATSVSPIYGTDSSFDVADPTAHSAEVDVKQAGTYAFMVCVKSDDGKTCTASSNVVKFTNK